MSRGAGTPAPARARPRGGRGRRAPPVAARVPGRPGRRAAAGCSKSSGEALDVAPRGGTPCCSSLGVAWSAVVVGGPARVARHEDRPSRPTALGHRGSPPLRHPELRRRVLPTWLLRRARDPRGRARRRAPARDPRGYWGSLSRAHARRPTRTYSCSRSPRCAGSTPRSRRRPAVSAARRGAIFLRVTAAGTPARSWALGALLVALYTLSDFGVVSLMNYDTLTRAIYVQYKSLFDRGTRGDARATARRADGDRARRSSTGSASAAVLYRSGPGTKRAACRSIRARAPDGRRPSLSALAVVGSLPRPPGGRARVLAELAGIANERELDFAVVGGSALRSSPPVLAAGRRRGGRAPRRSCWRCATRPAVAGCSSDSRTRATRSARAS